MLVAAELFLPHFGYRGIFAMLAINIVLALILLLRFVRVPNEPAVRILSIAGRGGEIGQTRRT